MKIDVLGTEYEILIQNDNPKMKDSDGFCEWVSKKIIITDSYRNDEDALENIDDYIHKVIRHEAFHALFAEMGIKKMASRRRTHRYAGYAISKDSQDNGRLRCV